MPLIRFPTVKGLVYTIDLSKIADRENPRTVEAPISTQYAEDIIIDWGDGTVDTFTKNAGTTWPEHTYGGTDNIFTVTIRSATGHLPNLAFCYAQQENGKKITKAVVSIDHFSAEQGISATSTYNYKCFYTRNLTYCDPRLAGSSKYTDMYYFFRASGITQDISSFCFDFCPITTSGYGFDYTFASTGVFGDVPSKLFPEGTGDITGVFLRCFGLTSIPADLFDGNVSLRIVTSAFQTCETLPSPYVFWKEDGTTDTDRFPNLTNTSNCYSGCVGMDRSKIPTDYGGTMTVS